MDNRNSFLELSIIWKDDDMFELKVKASNTDFYGTTEVYEQSERLSNFAIALNGYPKDENSLFYEAGEKNGYAYFSMKYYVIDVSGHIGVEVYLESKVPTEYRQEEKNKIKLEILIEPSAIDNFQKRLLHLARCQEGSAILYGKDNMLDN